MSIYIVSVLFADILIVNILDLCRNISCSCYDCKYIPTNKEIIRGLISKILSPKCNGDECHFVHKGTLAYTLLHNLQIFLIS